MTIHLPEDLKAFVHDAVRAGFYPRVDDVIRDALMRLRNGMDQGLEVNDPAGSGAAGVPMTEEEFKHKLIDQGLMSDQRRSSGGAPSRDFRPIPIEGEPLSEAIIRERR